MKNQNEHVDSPESGHLIESLAIWKSYSRSPYLSIKHSTYFQVYNDLFQQHRGKPITFVEIGVLNGGSLFMWRDFFGEAARIIGVDLNPEAARWKQDGFEIFIGNQSDPAFWESFFDEIGRVDVILDDGGHTYEQQVITAHCCIPHINDGGQLVIEDTHTSYFKEFGYPSKYTFMEWVKKVIDNINYRFPSISTSEKIYNKYVYSVRAFESIVCFEINQKKCFTSRPTQNSGKGLDAKDFRYVGTNAQSLASCRASLARRFNFLKNLPFVRPAVDKWFTFLHKALNRSTARKLKRYF